MRLQTLAWPASPPPFSSSSPLALSSLPSLPLPHSTVLSVPPGTAIVPPPPPPPLLLFSCFADVRRVTTAFAVTSLCPRQTPSYLTRVCFLALDTDLLENRKTKNALCWVPGSSSPLTGRDKVHPYRASQALQPSTENHLNEILL